jgi:siroheme decarboxylase
VKISAADKRIIRQIQGDLPLSSTPFATLARRSGIDEKEYLRRVHRLKRQGLIRRFGAILRHEQAGYQGNAMAVWRVEEDQIEKIGSIMASFPAVTHCYVRPAVPQWPYNLYTMLHGRIPEHCRELAEKISAKTGLGNYRLLFSKREHKKSSMRYFA